MDRRTFLDGVRIRPIIADATREVELRSGGVHIAHDLPYQDVDRVSQMAEIKLSRLLGSRWDYWRWNTVSSPYGSNLSFRHWPESKSRRLGTHARPTTAISGFMVGGVVAR